MKAWVVLRNFKRLERLEREARQWYLHPPLQRKTSIHLLQRVPRFSGNELRSLLRETLDFFDFVLESLRIEPLVRVGMRGGADLRDCALHLAFEPARF